MRKVDRTLYPALNRYVGSLSNEREKSGLERKRRSEEKSEFVIGFLPLKSSYKDSLLKVR
uniref:Uncharacterized protein n=1 Tax=Cucumis melo TaxID=3656 RepID=A0A9I9EDA9_CUCME